MQLCASIQVMTCQKSPTPNMSQPPQTNAHPFVPPSPRFQPGGLGADSKDAKALVKGCERVSSRKSSSPGRKDSPSSAKRRRKTSDAKLGEASPKVQSPMLQKESCKVFLGKIGEH